MPNIKIVSSNPLFQNILDEFENFERKLSPALPKLVELKDDPVVLACASYRMYKENPRDRWVDFSSVVVWQDDREEAERLKTYYREKFKEDTFQMLKQVNGSSMSPFRRKLYLLSNNDLVITEKEIGLLYRLPYFYYEDMALDDIVANTKTISETHPACKFDLNLTLYKKVLRSRSSNEINQYWFKEARSPHAFMLPVKTDNNLANFFESMATRPLHVESVVICKQMQGRPEHVYYQLAGPQLV